MRCRNYFIPTAGQGRRQAFTLIELSIVLVIIGLVVGGVLAGQDLIQAATLRAVISQQEQIKTSVNAFVAKYNCVPGDCAKASSFGLASGVAGVPDDGDGDSIIGPTDGNLSPLMLVTPGNEMILMWAHLHDAGLISNYAPPGAGNYGSSSWPAAFQPWGIGFPARIRQCAWWAGYDAGASNMAWAEPVGMVHLGNTITLAGPVTRCSFSTCGGAAFSECLLPEEAQNIDAKIDDGLPWTGHIHAEGGGNYIDNPAPSGAGGWASPPDQCVVNSSMDATYASPVTNNKEHCNIMIKLGQ